MILLAACGGGGGNDSQPTRRDPPDPAPDAVPTAEAGNPITRTSGQTVTLGGSGSDPEGGTLRFSWEQQAGQQPRVTLQNAGSAQATFTAPDVTENTTLTFALTVTDPGNQTDDDTVEITITPTVGVSGARITSEPESDDTYGAGDAITVEVAFTGTVTLKGGNPTLTLDIGTGTVQASYSTGGGTNTLTFRYSVKAGEQDADGIGIAADALQTGTASIVDANGQDVNASLGSHAIANDEDHKVETSPLHVTDVRIVPRVRGRGDTHGEDDIIIVHVAFSGRVTASGDPIYPSLPIVVGTQIRQADYEGGSGTDTLIFHYTVQDNDRDADGISIEAEAIKLNDGYIADPKGREVDARLGSHTITNDAAHKVDGSMASSTADLPTPTVVGVSVSRAQAENIYTYGATEVIRVEVEFSHSVVVTGEPLLTLVIGTEKRIAEYKGGSGAETLFFEYKVQAGDTDADGIEIADDGLAGGSITGELGGRPALLSLGDDTVEYSQVRVDGSVDRIATVTDMVISSRPKVDDTYSSNEKISAWVTFSEIVTVTGSPPNNGPRLMLTIDGGTRPALLRSTGDLRRLQFDYTVESTDADTDGVSIAADALQLGSNGSIVDAGDQPANLALDTVAIDNNSNHKVNGELDTPPTANAGPNVRAITDTTVTLSGGSSEDAQTDTADLTYAWSQLCGPTVALSGRDSMQVMFTATTIKSDAAAPPASRPIPELPTGVQPFSAYTTLTFELTVTDERDNQDTDTVTVTVDPGIDPAGPFEPSSNRENQCASPRPGSDDTQGEVEDENHWLRSWSHEEYLWYDEIVDGHDPASYDTATYFDLMQTYAEAASCGKPKDEFHFFNYDIGTSSTSLGLSREMDDREAGFGAVYGTVNASELVVKFVHGASPMGTVSFDGIETVGLQRGDKITRIDDISININTLRQGTDTRRRIERIILSGQVGEAHTFTIMRPGMSRSMTAQITTAAYVVDPVPDYDVIETDTGRVGYLLFVNHIDAAKEELETAISFFENQRVTDLVLDLRYNAGGLLEVARELASMIANPSATSGQVYERLMYNGKGDRRDDAEMNNFVQDASKPNLALDRLFVITSQTTCSASESIINGLRGVDIEVIQIGETTCGKPYGTTPTPNCGKTYYSTQFIGVNAKDFGDYEHGFAPEQVPPTASHRIDENSVRIPGCYLQDIDFDHDLGDQEEAMLARALTYRDTSGSCTVSNASGMPSGFDTVPHGGDTQANSETIMHPRPGSSGRIVER